MMPVALKVLADGSSRPLREVFELVCQLYAFTPEQLAHTLPSGRQTTLRSRVGWAKTYLVKAGLIEQPKRGICLITERGKAALASGQTIDNHYLAQFGEFLAFGESIGRLLAVLSNAAEAQKPEQARPPQEQIEQVLAGSTASLRKTGSASIPSTCRPSATPIKSWVVPRSKPLPGRSIYTAPARGCLSPPSALAVRRREYVGLIEKRIVLIDGRELAPLMIEHNVGVSTSELYAVKAIDSDYFLEE